MAAQAGPSPQTVGGTLRAIPPNLADVASYWLIAAAIYLTYGTLFYFAGKEKLIDDSGTMPAALAKSFQGTFISSFPGTNVSWAILGVLEAAIFLLLAVSVLTGEFLPSRRKPLLLSGLGLSAFTFSVLAFGQNLTAQNSGVSELFQYLAGTAVLIVLVLLMPPYRERHWLSGLLAPGERNTAR